MIVSFTGHRPDRLGTGYSITNDRCKAYSGVLKETLIPLIENENTHTFITGGAIGIDQIAFWTIESLKKKYPDIQNELAIPFELQYSKWKNDELISWYHRMIETADQVAYIDAIPAYADRSVPFGEYSGKKMQLRNQYMVDHSDVLIAVYDGSKSGTGNCVKYAQDHGKKIIYLHPLVFR